MPSIGYEPDRRPCQQLARMMALAPLCTTDLRVHVVCDVLPALDEVQVSRVTVRDVTAVDDVNIGGATAAWDWVSMMQMQY